MVRSLLLFVILSVLSVAPSLAQEIEYETKDVITGTNIPWEIRWGRDGWIWFTERHGRMQRVNPETGESKVLLVAPSVLQLHESGMLGFDFHPDFPDSPYVYVAYTHEETWPAKLDLFRYTYSNDTLIDRQLVFTGMRSNYMHVGCRVVIHDRKIYLTVGDVDNGALAQMPSSLNGKTLRINLDGSIPADNPWAGSAIWTMGHRNPQGLVFGPTGILYSTEHGFVTSDELNILEPGQNYGWPLVEGICDTITEMVSCDTLNVRQPIHDWTPTLGVSGADFYYHDAIPEWKNSVLVAGLKDQSIVRFKMDSTGRNILEYRYFRPVLTSTGSHARRIRDYCISPDGRVFFSTSNTIDVEEPEDGIYELTKTGTIPYSITQIAPEDQSKVYADSATFVWRKTAGDSYYQVEVSTNAEFPEGTVSHDLTVTDTSVVVRGLTLSTDYYWRVRELTSGGPWSVFRFSIPSSSVTSDIALWEAQIHFTNERITINLARQNSDQLPVQLIDARGAVLWDGVIPAGMATHTIDASSLASGSYQLMIGKGKQLLSKQVLIVR